MSIAIVLRPNGHLIVESAEEAEPLMSEAAARRLSAAFTASTGEGLENLAGAFLHEPLPPTLSYWREFARLFVGGLCHAPGASAETLVLPEPPEEALQKLAEKAPPMKGLEYLNASLLALIWSALQERVRAQLAERKESVQEYLRQLNPAWHALGRVTLHLAENKRNAECPFAFLATYTHRLSEHGKAQHLPLGRALQEYAGAHNRPALTALLSPLQLASEKSAFIRELLEQRAIFQPQVWTAAQAYRFLKEIPLFEESGLSIRIPDWWKAGRPPRAQVSVKIGNQASGSLGQDQLLDFKMELTLEGEPLSEAEWESILKSSEGLALIKGKWVEIDPGKLQEVLAHWKKAQAGAGQDGISLLEGLRLISGYNPETADAAASDGETAACSQVVAGDWLKQTLEEMHHPKISEESEPGPGLQAELRPYQRQGVHWLWFMSRLGLGACLADDMGLGKTMQVIALLLALKRNKESRGEKVQASVLVVPASLIGNWKAELARFAPSLTFFIAHPSETSTLRLEEVGAAPEQALAQCDLVITSYALLLRLPWLRKVPWNLAILDEAQAIKNPSARQTRAAKELPSRCRIALSGTPIENRPGDLWSLFDFLCPGLLGGAKEFARFVKNRSAANADFTPVRRLVRPYILRRLKTDRRIISDLPEKTELQAYCSLSRPQAVLYQLSVEELAEILDSPATAGIKRRGVILAFLTRFKQICNHPSQWLADGAYQPADSGKFQRLREITEEIAARQEKALVFTQYREMTEPLAWFLEETFGRPGLVLHGEITVKKRKGLVDAFQSTDGPPFFVLSLKAGGTGLNLTAAAHVIHFDRWWNPAVENQATDRAFRIGQKRNVLVHKFICRGTLEERIDGLIASKRSLAEEILSEGAERLFTEMGNSELLQFVALDMKSIVAD